MAFNGTLLTFGSYKIPLDYIIADTYKITPNQRQDLDSYRDADGILRRNALSHTASKIEFDTQPLSGDKMDAFMANIRSNYINYNERNAKCTYYDPETGSYKTGELYLADPQWNLLDCSSSGWILYGPTKFTLVEY